MKCLCLWEIFERKQGTTGIETKTKDVKYVITSMQDLIFIKSQIVRQ